MSAKGVPRKRLRWPWWVALGAVIVIVAGFVAARALTGGQAQATFVTGTVQKTDLTDTVTGSGSLTAKGVTQVQPGITGTVKDLAVSLGDTVTAGQLLFRIVNDDLDAAVTRAEVSYQQAKQQVQQAQISLTQAQNNLHNAQHPSSVGTAPPPAVDASAAKVAQQQVTLAQMGVTTAKMSLSSAAMAVDKAEETADKRTVAAPVSGLVTELNATNGQALTSGGTSSASSASGSSSTGSAVEIADMGTLRARLQINEVDLVDVKVGQKATVEFDSLPGGDASGTVSAIAPTGTNTQGVVTYDVDVTLDSIDARLKSNMSCTVEIVTETKKDALVVPTSALRTDASTKGKYVLVVSGQQTRRADVKTGLVVGTNTEILSGLTEGQTIVTSSSSVSTSSSTSNDRSGGAMGGMGAMLGGGRP